MSTSGKNGRYSFVTKINIHVCLVILDVKHGDGNADNPHFTHLSAQYAVIHTVSKIVHTAIY